MRFLDCGFDLRLSNVFGSSDVVRSEDGVVDTARIDRGPLHEAQIGALPPLESLGRNNVYVRRQRNGPSDRLPETAVLRQTQVDFSMAMGQQAADPEEVRRILRLMDSDPVVREEVRRAVLTQGCLLELPQRLAAYIEVTDRRLLAIDRRLDAVESGISELERTLAAFIETTDRRFAGVDSDLKQIKTDLAGVKGDGYERRVRERAPALLSRVAGGLRRLRVLSTNDLADQLDEAVDAGKITESERDEILRADAVARAVSRTSGHEVHLVVEVSVTLGAEDVRCALLRRDLMAQALEGEAVGVVVSAQVPTLVVSHDIEVVRFAFGQ